MSFQDAWRSCLSNYATFGGRARRSEFWYFYLGLVLINIVVNVLGRTSSSLGTLLGSIVFLATIVPWLAVAARRLHDTGRSAWLLLLILIPVIGWIPLLIFYIQDSHPAENQYGPSPKPAFA